MILKQSFLAAAALLYIHAHGITAPEVLDIGKRAYTYAYPLVMTAITQAAMLKNQPAYNQFTHVSTFPDDTFTDVARANVDTLYSYAWLDLSKGPLTLSVPDTSDRYYLLQFMDAWTNVFKSIGKRTTGTKAQTFVIVGPDYKGALPAGEVIKSPTNMVFLLARTQTNSKQDAEQVKTIQTGYKLTPVAGATAGTSSTAKSNGQPPTAQVGAMNAQAFYTLFAQELKNNPPAAADTAILADLKKIGIEPGKDYNPEAVPADMRGSLDTAMAAALKEITNSASLGQLSNGWSVTRNIGTYGTTYLLRAIVAYVGIGANLPEDAIYPTAYVDGSGNPLTGTNKYVIHFDKNMTPPAQAFWSITAYNSNGFLIKNPLNRFALGDRDKLTLNADGSLDIYVQYESPGKDKEANWLPVPQGPFNLTMRIYWPKSTVLDGSWNPPAIKKV